MKWWKCFKKILGVFGMKMAGPYGKCISSLEEEFNELSNEENFLALAMLDSGINCDLVYDAIRILRRKRSFLRKLREKGFGTQLSDQLFHDHIEDIKGSKKVDDIVIKAYQVYTEQKEEKKNLDRAMKFGENKI